MIDQNRTDRELMEEISSLMQRNQELEKSELDRRSASEVLLASEELFRKIFEKAHPGIVITSPSFAFEKANPAFCHMMGYSEDELRSMTFSNITHPDHLKQDMENVKKVGQGEIPFYQTEKRYINKSGKVLWGDLIVSSIHDEHGALRYYIEKRSLEERLQHAEKMEAIGTLVGGVAHDLNNMLGVLIGNAEMLIEDLDKTNPLRRLAEEIMSSGERAATEVQDLLIMARLGVVWREPANLNRIVADLLRTPEIRKMISAHPHVTIETQYERDLLSINASVIHIERALTNLFRNALRALPKAGTISIKTENRYLDLPLNGYEEVPKGEYAVLSISDTGIGILPEHMKHLFEPFYMRKALKQGGTGLGLSMIWGALKDHDGYIDVSSEPGKGTTFTFYFSVTRGESVLWEMHPTSEYMGNGEAILVVDDEESQCRLAALILTRLNYRVKTVESGEKALEYLANNDADLVVLDMRMEPGMDGYDTYKKILEIKKRQKAIILSGFSMTERAKMAQELGAGEFIMKPYLIERLGITVRNELDRK
jgi:two-component system cell cycle sensor histidine kinase/response regulator CckA